MLVVLYQHVHDKVVRLQILKSVIESSSLQPFFKLTEQMESKHINLSMLNWIQPCITMTDFHSPDCASRCALGIFLQI